MGSEWLLISGMALVTFAIRYPLLALSGSIRLPDALIRGLTYVPPVVLTAIVVPVVLIPDGQTLWLQLDNPRLVGSLACIAVGLWRRNLLLTIVVGMGTFWVWQLVWG
jgi:branched-subunit amino acid transport protein